MEGVGKTLWGTLSYADFLASSVKLISIPYLFFIEASAPAEVELLRMVAVRLSPKVYEVTSGQRRYLHLAAVFCL